MQTDITQLDRRRRFKPSTIGLIGIVCLLLTGIVRLKYADGDVNNITVMASSYSFTPSPTPIVYDLTGADYFVGLYADEYGKSTGQKSKLRSIMHCLLNKETVHWNNKGHGDSGRAGGPLQFHETTWLRMRKQMLNTELVHEIGSRYDLEASIETTVWALTQGRGREWGPILRGECPNL